MLLGALAGRRRAPASATPTSRTAIREGGVAVERNLAGFKAGRDVAAGATRPDGAPSCARGRSCKAERAAAPGAAAAPTSWPSARTAEAEFPAALHRPLGEAAGAPDRTTRTRDTPRDSSERVRSVRAWIRARGSPTRFARRLAVWMSYEDAIRVADLKTRRSRFERIRASRARERAHR